MMITQRYFPIIYKSVCFLLVSLVFVSLFPKTSYGISEAQRKLYKSNVLYYDIEPEVCSDNPAGGEEADGDGVVGGEYSSGLQPPYILEQWAIHVLKALAQFKGISEDNTVTKNHVVALIAFALGEGGDINNPQKFNPLNLGGWSEYVDGATAGDGVQSFKSFDAGVTAVAKQFLASKQNRLGNVLIKPGSTPKDFMKALSYYDDYPGNSFWAGASVGNQDSYYNGRLQLVQTVTSDYASIASFTIGTPNFKDQPSGSRKTGLLQFNDGAGVTDGESSITEDGGSTCEPPPCPPGTDGAASASASTPSNWVKMYTGSNKAKVDHMARGSLPDPKALIIHFTQGDGDGQSLLNFFNTTFTGIQFSVGKDGKVYQYFPLDDMQKTNHVENANSSAIGIEIIGRDADELLGNQTQFQSVVGLAQFLCNKYSISCGNPKGLITGLTDPSKIEGMLGHGEVPTNSHTDPDSPGGNPNYKHNDSKTHAYMIKLRTAMGFNPTPSAGGADSGGGAAGSQCTGMSADLTEAQKKVVGEGPNQALAIQAIKYDTKSNPKYQYVFGGGHGSLSQIQAFDKDGTGGIDCSGFIRLIIWKVYGYDIGPLATGGIATSSNFKEIPQSEVAAGDLGWRPEHVDFITKNSGGELYQFGAHSAANDLYGGKTTFGNYDKFFRYIGPKG